MQQTPFVASGTDSHLNQLKSLKREFDDLSRHGLLKEALECREAFAEIEAQYYLQPSRDVAQTVLSLNAVAIKSLAEGSTDAAKEVLGKSLCLLNPGNVPERARMELRAITLNNLSCCKMKQGSPDGCLNYLKQALDIELTLYDERAPANLVSTSMNMTVVLSNLGRHREALRYAEKCAHLLQQLAKSGTSTDIGKVPTFSLSLDGPAENVGLDANIRCIAWYNLGVEQEHNRMPERAVSSYRRAQKYAEEGSMLFKMVGDAVIELEAGIQSGKR